MAVLDAERHALADSVADGGEHLRGRVDPESLLRGAREAADEAVQFARYPAPGGRDAVEQAAHDVLADAVEERAGVADGALDLGSDAAEEADDGADGRGDAGLDARPDANNPLADRTRGRHGQVIPPCPQHCRSGRR